MLNYLRGEFYKVFRRSYTWITLGVVLALEALLVAGWTFTNANGNHVDFYTGAAMLIQLLPAGFYATLFTADMVFAGQYKFGTMKNEVSFGIPRSRIYLGKLLAETILALLACVVMLGFYLALCWIFLLHDPETDAAVFPILGYCLTASLPLWLGCQALSCLCFFLFKNDYAATFAAVAVIIVIPSGLDIFSLLFEGPVGTALRKLHDLWPTTLLETAPRMVGDSSLLWLCAAVGAVWLAGFTALGLWRFSRREIH